MPADRHLNPDEFTSSYLPTEYGSDWDEVEGDETFLSGEGWKVDDLANSIKKSGVKKPVYVYKNSVMEGHHRVVAARRAGKPIPFIEMDDPFTAPD